MSMPSIAGSLAMPAMNSPAFVALLIFVTIGYRLGATMIDTLGSKF
jgi:hypothetical protein